MGLKILQWNSNGLRNKTYELKSLLLRDNYDVICIQETHLTEKVNYELNGYSIIRRDRELRKKGGLLIAVKEGLTYQTKDTTGVIEYQHIELQSKEGNIHILNVYIKPLEVHVTSHLTHLFNQTRAIVLGDFNAKHHLWMSKTEDLRGKELADIINNSSTYTVLNNGQTTHQNTKGGMSTIDITFATTNIASKSSWYTHHNLMGSDHTPITITIDHQMDIDL